MIVWDLPSLRVMRDPLSLSEGEYHSPGDIRLSRSRVACFKLGRVQGLPRFRTRGVELVYTNAFRLCDSGSAAK
jgi:hypothetical protein